MRKFLPVLPLVFSLIGRAHAEVPSSFEAALDGVHLQVGAVRAEQAQAKKENLSERMRKTAVAVNALTNELYSLPNDIFDLRERSGNPRDPRLRPDVNDLVVKLRYTRERVASHLAAVQEFRRLAGKDLDLHQSAMDLARVSLNLKNKIKLVEDEWSKTAWPLRRAGFDAQVDLIANDSHLLSLASANLAAEAAELYKQVVSR